MTRPLGSTRITGLHSYHETVRPCAPHRYSAPRGSAARGVSLPRTAAGQRLRHWSCAGAGRQVHTFPTGARTRLAPPPRRTPPGQSAGSRQAHPRPCARAWFRCRLWDLFDASSVVRLRSPSWPTPAALIGATFPPTLSTPALDRRTSWWFVAFPAGRPRRTTDPTGPAPRSPMQHRIRWPDLLHLPPCRVRVHTAHEVQLRMRHRLKLPRPGEAFTATDKHRVDRHRRIRQNGAATHERSSSRAPLAPPVVSATWPLLIAIVPVTSLVAGASGSAGQLLSPFRCLHFVLGVTGLERRLAAGRCEACGEWSERIADRLLGELAIASIRLLDAPAAPGPRVNRCAYGMGAEIRRSQLRTARGRSRGAHACRSVEVNPGRQPRSLMSG
jgi:hypothetical protein